MDGKPFFTEHYISHGQGRIYTRDYAGAEPAFVLMHGFPDNLRIYDDLVPHLVAAGRRVVTFDFLGFGASDKLPGAIYNFGQQLGDLETVIDVLGLETIVPVAHDSSGPTAINFTLAHPQRVESLCILNSGYDDAFPIVWPEMVTLFATHSMSALSAAIAQSPAQFGWLLGWQKTLFADPLPPDQKERFETSIGQLIADNFTQPPSSGPAFMQLASHFFAELARNTRRLAELKNLDLPVKVIWGELDPYITADVGKNRASHFQHATLYLLPAGHWVQSDMPAEVAQAMLS
ncbi:MAG: alpha/beta hydrolase fold protein [Capsulimonas sp.]|nr:alpha/beta hydrolase fold protein [Capsulimonas sp.]